MEKPIVFFDGVCNLCSSSVKFILTNEKNQNLQFASLQSDFGQEFLRKNHLATKNFESIVFYKNGKIYKESDAALEIAKNLKFPFSLLLAFTVVPKILRDPIYQWIAKNRYSWFGKTESCWLPSPEYKKRFLG